MKNLRNDIFNSMSWRPKGLIPNLFDVSYKYQDLVPDSKYKLFRNPLARHTICTQIYKDTAMKHIPIYRLHINPQMSKCWTTIWTGVLFSILHPIYSSMWIEINFRMKDNMKEDIKVQLKKELS
jgi:hypothetical protein